MGINAQKICCLWIIRQELRIQQDSHKGNYSCKGIVSFSVFVSQLIICKQAELRHLSCKLKQVYSVLHVYAMCIN